MKRFLRWPGLCMILLAGLFSITSCMWSSQDLVNLAFYGVDITTPFPLDRGNQLGSVATYKGLPLKLADRGTPQVEPVDNVIGLLCMGMSNASIECTDFLNKVQTGIEQGIINPQVRVVNCAVGGHAIERWNDPSYDEMLWGACIHDKIPAAGLRPDQIRVVWHKAASQFTADLTGKVLPPYPDPDSDYFRFYDSLSTFAMLLKIKLPAVQAVYTSSRSYGGFARREHRGEPLSFEEGIALNEWLNHQDEDSDPWFGWGPYIWAPDCETGITNRSEICYDRSDFRRDGIHPEQGALDKITHMLHSHFSQHRWYQNR